MNQTTDEIDEINDDDLPSFLRSDTAKITTQKAPENFQQAPFLLKENMPHIKTLKEQEDTEMLLCYKRLMNIMSLKCKNCILESCMDCVFNKAGLFFLLRKSLALMESTNKSACLKVFNMDEDTWHALVDEY